jgi:hypothetical protein
MGTFNINGQSVQLDESLEYYDFYLVHRNPKLVRVNWQMILSNLQSGEWKWEPELVHMIRQLSRWVNEAPRKCFLRELRQQGAEVMTTEYLFDQDDGHKIIDALENSGKVAAILCRVHGVEPMRPSQHPDPSQPILGPMERWEKPK